MNIYSLIIYKILNNYIILRCYFLSKRNKEAFALPQILVLAIGISISLIGLMNASINRLSTSKLNKTELQAKNSTESAFNSVRTILNNSKGVQYYYWLLKTCSSSSKNSECPTFGGGQYGNQWPGYFNKGRIHDPSRLYWVDTNNIWCDGISKPQCIGRQVAPSCSYLGRNGRNYRINWGYISRDLSNFVNGSEKVLNQSGRSNSNIQSFVIKSTDFVGNESGGENSLLLEGYNSTSRSLTTKNATNKIRANIEIFKTVPDAGFAFISAGENERDENSLFLGNFKLFNNNQKGTILWRKNINPNNAFAECGNIRNDSGIGSYFSRLPDSNNDSGGIWVQPLELPSRPTIKNQGQLGSIWRPYNNPIICLGDQTFGKYFGPNCRFLETNGFYSFRNQDRTYTIDDLIVRGKDAFFGIATTDQSRVTLIVRGSIDLSNGGRICHRNGGPNASCGSGKPENLTILLQQSNQNKESKKRLQCSSRGGIRYVRDQRYSLNHSNNIPFNTFNVSSTGDNGEYFSAFVYAPDTTFSTAKPETEYYSRAGRSSKLVSTVKGVYAYIHSPGGSVYDRTPKVFRNISGGLIPYTTEPDKDSWDRNRHGFDDVYIIAAGTRGSGSNPEKNGMLDMALIWDSVRDNYFLIGYVIQNNEVRFVDRNINGREWKIDLGSDPFFRDRTGNVVIYHYGMDLRRRSSLPKKQFFKGSIWVKNACFDKATKGEVIWDFDSNYNDNLVKRFNYNNQYNFGVPYYRGKSIKVWDTLRDFN